MLHKLGRSIEPFGRVLPIAIARRRIAAFIIIFIALLAIRDSFKENLPPIFSSGSPGNKSLLENIMSQSIGKDGSAKAEAEMRHEEKQQPQLSRLQLPKVALLFLTRGPMPLESIWKDFLGIDHITGDNDSPKWQQYFSIHVHAAPGFTYPSESLFHFHTIKRPIEAQWGKHSMIDAERKLLQAGLEDPLNKYFVLLSETHIPLYSAAATYLTLATETYSRIRACGNSSDESDIRRRMTYRMTSEMNESGITEHTWRKSSQWFGLIRSHAKLVVEESVVDNAFKQYCYVDYDRFCASDEHYIPTMLAINKKEADCACDGHMTRVIWNGNFMHPKTFGKIDATMGTLRHELRRELECTEGPRLLSTADEVLTEIDAVLVGNKSLVNGKNAMITGEFVLRNTLKRAKVATLKQDCPLFGRKIDKDAELEWREVLKVLY